VAVYDRVVSLCKFVKMYEFTSTLHELLDEERGENKKQENEENESKRKKEGFQIVH
jgi:hypothetical protein